MRARFRSRIAPLAAAAAVLGCAAFAQSAPDTETRTFQFQNITTVSGTQQIADAIGTVSDLGNTPDGSFGTSLLYRKDWSVSDLGNITPDGSGMFLTVTGTAAQVGMAAWAFQELDQLPAATASATTEHAVPGTTDVARVFHFPNTASGVLIAETTTAIRTLTQLPRLFPCAESGAILARGPAEGMALTAWLMSALDKPSGWTPAESERTLSYEYAAGSPHEVRVFYPAHLEAPQALAELTNVTRTLTQTQYLIPVSGAKAIAERGTPHQAELTQWLVEALDKPPGWKPAEGQNPARTQFAVDLPGANGQVALVRVFYLPSNKAQDLAAAVNRLRAEAKIQFIMPDVTAGAIVLRGNAAQVAQAEEMLLPPAAAPGK